VRTCQVVKSRASQLTRFVQINLPLQPGEGRGEGTISIFSSAKPRGATLSGRNPTYLGALTVEEQETILALYRKIARVGQPNPRTA
jgi:hypothetical protein